MRGRYRRLRRAWKPAAVFGALMFLSAAAGGPAAAQQAVCPNPAGNPAADDWISCKKGSSATDSIVISLNGFDIDDSDIDDPIDAAVYAHHGGSGDNADIDIDVTGGSITVSGATASRRAIASSTATTARAGARRPATSTST